MTYKCELIERTAQPTLAIRTRTRVEDLSQLVGQSYGAIAQYMGQMGKQPAGAPYAAYFNEDLQDLDTELGFPTPGKLAGKDNIHASEIPGGQAVTCLHVGPYPELGAAYQALSQWMHSNGYEGTGVSYEIYLNDASQTPPEALQTQLIFPLKAK